MFPTLGMPGFKKTISKFKYGDNSSAPTSLKHAISNLDYEDYADPLGANGVAILLDIAHDPFKKKCQIHPFKQAAGGKEKKTSVVFKLGQNSMESHCSGPNHPPALSIRGNLFDSLRDSDEQKDSKVSNSKDSDSEDSVDSEDSDSKDSDSKDSDSKDSEECSPDRESSSPIYEARTISKQSTVPHSNFDVFREVVENTEKLEDLPDYSKRYYAAQDSHGVTPSFEPLGHDNCGSSSFYSDEGSYTPKNVEYDQVFEIYVRLTECLHYESRKIDDIGVEEVVNEIKQAITEISEKLAKSGTCKCKALSKKQLSEKLPLGALAVLNKKAPALDKGPIENSGSDSTNGNSERKRVENDISLKELNLKLQEKEKLMKQINHELQKREETIKELKTKEEKARNEETSYQQKMEHKIHELKEILVNQDKATQEHGFVPETVVLDLKSDIEKQLRVFTEVKEEMKNFGEEMLAKSQNLVGFRSLKDDILGLERIQNTLNQKIEVIQAFTEGKRDHQSARESSEVLLEAMKSLFREYLQELTQMGQILKEVEKAGASNSSLLDELLEGFRSSTELLKRDLIESKDQQKLNNLNYSNLEEKYRILEEKCRVLTQEKTQINELLKTKKATLVELEASHERVFRVFVNLFKDCVDNIYPIIPIEKQQQLADAVEQIGSLKLMSPVIVQRISDVSLQIQTETRKLIYLGLIMLSEEIMTLRSSDNLHKMNGDPTKRREFVAME